MNRLLLALCLLSISSSAFADQPMSLIRTLCIPEAGIGHFAVNTEVSQTAADFVNGYSSSALKNAADRIALLKKYGLIVPKDYSSECKVGTHIYKIYGDLPPAGDKGMCGGDPRTIITLEKDRVKILDKAFFDSSCFSSTCKDPYPYIKSFEIDTADNGDSVYLAFLYSDGMHEKRIHIGADKIVDQQSLDCLAQKGLLKENVGEAALKQCIK